MITMAEHPVLRGDLRHDEAMASHTSWRVGGPAQHFYEPADLDDLAVFLRQLPEDEPLMFVGLGSNLLVRDGGIAGTVVCTTGALSALDCLDDQTVRAEAGVSCAKLARYCARYGLVGAEFFAGIPGSFGGALAMNAGAFGGETWPLVQVVETIDRRGKRRVRFPEDFRVAYREVAGPPGEWFVAAHLHLAKGDGEASLDRVKALLERRNLTQPIGQPSCGSVFRNPPGDHAARLIEACGLKGLCIGAACVSTKHANFIINTGKASARDIEVLIERVEQEVFRTHGIRLVREVHIVGSRGES